MKVILYMAMSANGFIAKADDNTDFVSAAEWESFRSMIRKVGNMVIGRRTYDIMRKSNEFSGFDKAKVVVVTQDKIFKAYGLNHFIAGSAQQAVAFLEKQGFGEALVAGGGILNSSFMKQNLIDEIYLDIEPVIFGKGIRVFAEDDFEVRLKLVGIKKISENVVQLHYRIGKN